MLEGLNANQSQAAEAVQGPVIVFAGAGSGKTRTLTFRILHMVVNCHIDPHNILAITFTNKATNVMKERLGAYKDVNVRALTISTFHSLCAMILRRDIEYLGYNRDFNIVDEEEQLKVIGEVVKEAGLEKKQEKHFQKVINFNKCFMTKPTEQLDLEIFEKYQEKMLELNMLDFEDLLLKVYQLFAEFPEVLCKYQERFKYILVDEFQDTNLVQYKIVRLLAIKHRNLFVVGDDDQSIYSFRGTNYENIRLFKEDFNEYQMFTLNENYRSTQTILDYANRLISFNKDREPKEMITAIPGHMDDVVTYQARNELDEVNFVVDKIESLKSSLTNYSDFAVLYRSSVLLRNLEIALIRRQIPYKVYGGISYLRRKEVKDIVAYFKLMLNPNDTLSFKRIVNTPTRGIGLATIEKIDSIHKTYRLNYFDAIKWSESILPKSKFSVLNDFVEMIIKYRNRIEIDSLLDIFDDLIQEIEYFKYLKDEYEEKEAEERLANLIEFKSILYTLETTNPDENKLDKIREAFDDAVLSDDHLQNQKENKLGVTISTIHSVKGLEFDTVFIIGMEEDIFPNTSRLISEAELEEERRIAYVAMTRAKKKLFMTVARKRLLYGRFFENEPSRFLIEAIGANDLDNFEDVTSSQDEKKYLNYQNKYHNHGYNYNKQTNQKLISDNFKKSEVKENDGDFKISDTVIHAKFGEGIILGIENGIGNIFFKNEKATKKILLNHPSISKK